MAKIRFLIFCIVLLFCPIRLTIAQERINEFIVNVDETHNPMTIYSGYGATPNDGVVIVSSTIPDCEFNIPSAPGRIRAVPDKKRNRYVLIIQPNDNNYRQYTITINATGFKQGKLEGVVVKAGLSSGYIVNPKFDINKSSNYYAEIIVYGKDGKPLEGAKLTNRETGKSERTNSDGVGTIKFDKEGQVTNITVSHFRYSDTKDVAIRVGDNQRVTLLNYNPPTPPGNPKPPRVSFFKPELFTFYWDFSGSVNFDDTPLDISSITNFNTSLGVAFSYFQIGLGVGSISPPEQTTSSNLVNAGYTGNFTKTTTTKISNSPLNIFLDLGACFKWFSVSCQVGWLCNATIDRTSLYNGWGYGLVDEDVNEYWGNYEQRSFTNASSSKKSYFTLTPKVKLNLPIGESIGISLGLGYTIIPAMKYYVGLSGCLGIYFY